MTFGKRQLVIGALVVALGAAVYLNWQFSDNQALVETESEASTVKQLGQTTYVNTELTASKAETSVQTSGADKKTSAVSKETSKAAAQTSTDSGKDSVFAEEKKKRDESNEKALEAFTDLMEAASSNEKEKEAASQSARALAESIKKQTDIENEIRSRGFQDALVILNNGSCSVSVYGKELDDAAALMIKDIVNRQAGTDFDKITVSQAYRDSK